MRNLLREALWYLAASSLIAAIVLVGWVIPAPIEGTYR